MLIKTLGVPEEKIVVFPNGIDKTVFRTQSKREMRIKHGLPGDQFLVVSVGNFLLKKGVVRVGQAIDGVDGVGGLFIGSGPVPPITENSVLTGRISHSVLPDFLAAADVFVLPTLVEGCCNAIIEAMACGLPVISSDRSFNDDLLNDEMSIRIDPKNIDDIRKAIIALRDDPERREAMGKAALDRSKLFDINDRAMGILSHMEDSCS